MPKIGKFLVVVFLLSLTSCGTLTITDVSPEDAKQLHDDRNVPLDTEMDRLVSPLVKTGYTPGAVAGVLLPDGSMHFYSFGVANQETHKPLSEDTLFAVGSVSKGYLAIMTTEFVKEGKLSWNQTLEQLLPPGTKLSPDAKKITLFQLATHTAGLPRQPINLQTLSYFVEYLFDGETFYPQVTKDYIFDYLADFEADDPGKVRYSNIGYGLIAYILQKRSGKTMDQLLAERITTQLHLKCTGYHPERLPCHTDRAYGYAGDSPWFIPRGNPTPDWDFTPFMNGAAGLHSTARDLLTYAKAYLDKSTSFGKTISGNLRQRVSDPAGGGVGIGWTIDKIDGQPINYEIGLVAGYTSYVGIDPAHKTAVVLLQNSFNWDSSVGHKILVYLRNAPHVKNP